MSGDVNRCFEGGRSVFGGGWRVWDVVCDCFGAGAGYAGCIWGWGREGGDFWEAGFSASH